MHVVLCCLVKSAPQATRSLRGSGGLSGVRPKSPGGVRASQRGSKTRLPAAGAEADGRGDTDPALSDLGRELQMELDTYKKENAAVKAARKQQEAALADITQQRTKVRRRHNAVIVSSKCIA